MNTYRGIGVLLALLPANHVVKSGSLADVPRDFPSSEYVALSKDVLDLLKRPASSFRETEKYVNESRKIESAKYKVGLPSYAGETGWNSPGESKV